MVLRYAHVHGRHIDEAIKAIGRTIPQLPENKTARTITPKLHAGRREAAAQERVARNLRLRQPAARQNATRAGSIRTTGFRSGSSSAMAVYCG